MQKIERHLAPFRQLKVWQEAALLVREIYELTSNLPDSEKFGMISQLRRAAVSIGANIAEGSRYRTNGGFARFLEIADGSAAEVECLLLFLVECKLAPPEAVKSAAEKADAIQRMLQSLHAACTRPKPSVSA